MSYQHPKDNHSAIDLQKAQEFFPRSAATFAAIFEHGATVTMNDLADDPIAGREWMKKHYSLLKKLEQTLIPELMEMVKMNDSHDATMEYRSTVVKTISIRLRGVLRCAPDDAIAEHGDEISRFIKGSLHRSIQLKWFIECLNDRRYRPVIANRCERVRKGIEDAESQGDALSAQLTMVMNEAEGYLMMAQDYLEKFNFKPPENTRLATTTLRSMNADLVVDIEQHQAYEVADSYTVVKDITQEPVLVTMGSCSVAPIFGWEGKAIGLVSMKSAAYEELFRSGEAGIDTFKNADVIKKQIDKVLGVDRRTAAKIDEKMEARTQKNDIGTAMLANSASIPYIITWEGRAKIPESTVGFGELFSAILKDGEKGEYLAEALRFQLLWYLRALTCRSEMQPKEVSPSKIIRTVHKPKQIPSTIKLRMLPREPIPRTGSVPEKSELPSQDETGEKRKSPVEHKRRLPPGFYATPTSVIKAQQHGVQLAQETQEDGSIRYIETFVTPRKQEGDNPKVQTIQARLRESAKEALSKSSS